MCATPHSKPLRPHASARCGAAAGIHRDAAAAPAVSPPTAWRLAAVLHQRLSADDLPRPKLLRRQIPIVLSQDEVTRLIDTAPNLRFRTIPVTASGVHVRGLRQPFEKAGQYSMWTGRPRPSTSPSRIALIFTKKTVVSFPLWLFRQRAIRPARFLSAIAR